MPLEVGQRLGDYEVQQMLGVGGMGHVYRVRNIISNRTEAMKVLLPDLTAEPDLATRFISEIRTLASFDHPNIAQLHTALIAENQLIMMMEYVEGYTLEQIAKQRTMPVGEVAGYVSQALSALGYAHERGVVHRDVKPANLMVTSHGIVKLMDFGIAKSRVENNNHTRPGTTMGSLYYMSPEQVRGDTVDARSDIYSVGIVLYELLAGRRPFEADTTFTILNKQLNEQPQPPIELNPAIPAGLNAIILIALAKDPGQRFQNAEAFRNALKSYVTSPGAQEAAAPAMSVAAAAVAAANTPVPASATAFAATPTPQPRAAAAMPPAYAAVPQQQAGPTLVPAKPARSNKALWIATGAIAVVLALVAVGVAVPHWRMTHAAGSAATTAAATPSQDLPTLPPPPSDNPAPSGTSSTTSSQPSGQPPSTDNSVPAAAAQQSAGQPPAPASHEDVDRVKEHKQAEERKQEQARLEAQQAADLAAQQAAAQQARQRAAQQPEQPSRDPMQRPQRDGAEVLAQVQERMVDMEARANTARRQVGQIRKQQEAQGLGLRNDVESAESRLESYLNAAKADVARGDAMAARQDLNKAEPELNTLERFLGH
jgi:hypothetical protein